MTMEDISFSSLLQSAVANQMHPWATDSSGDLTMSTLISEESQYAIDPSSLHLGGSYDQQQAATDPMFQFTITSPFEDTQLPTPIPTSSTESTSSESRDASPSPEHTPSPCESISSINPSELDLYAQRAREATGVLLAVKAPPHQASHPHYPQPFSSVSPVVNGTRVHLPFLSLFLN